MSESLDELRAKIKILEKRAEEERRKIRESLVPQVKFELIRSTDRWDRTIHPDYQVIRLVRTVTNYLEIQPKGWLGDEKSGMSYFYNIKTCDFVAGTGGGYICIDEPEDFAKLSEFLRANPNGGDVTDIMKDVQTRYAKTGRL